MRVKIFLSLLFAFLFIQEEVLFAQSNPTDTTKKTTFVVLDNEYSEFFQSEEGSIHQLINNVKIRHGSDTLYCDTAILYQSKNRVDAIGNVAIFQEDGTKAFADYVRYTGNDRTVFMRADYGDVQLSDPEGNSLWSKEVYYNLRSKIGTYKKEGILKNGMTLVQSRDGVYNMRTKLARFKGNVIIQDPEYNVYSEDLSYHTETQDVQFFSPSIIYAEGGIFQTSGGTYNDGLKEGFFTTRSSVIYESQYLEADTIYHNEVDSNSWASGNVIGIDTLERTLLYAGYADYIGKLEEITAYQQPLLELLQEDANSLFIKGDTFFVFSEMRVQDSLTEQELLEKELEDLSQAQVSLMEKVSAVDTVISFGLLPNPLLYEDKGQEKKPILKATKDQIPDQSPLIYSEELTGISKEATGKQEKKPEIPIADTLKKSMFVQEDIVLNNLSQKASEDSLPKEKFKQFLITPYPLIFSDSLQAKSDTMIYAEKDSLFTMIGTPVLWSAEQQVTGEVIYVKMSEDKLQSFHVPSLGIMIALNKPEEAHFYNQLQAQDIKGYFKENSLDRLEAEGNAASIYYLVDDDEAYVGVSQATSDKIEVFMVDQEIDVIKYLGPTDQVMQPLHLANTAEKKLERFNWRGEEKVKDWDAFFALTRTPTMPQLFDWEPLNAKRWGAPERKTPKLGTYEEASEETLEGDIENVEESLDKEITEETIFEVITDQENAAEEGSEKREVK